MTREQPGDAKLRTEGSGLDLDALEKVAREGLRAFNREPMETLVADTAKDEFIATFDPPTVLRLIQTQRELAAALKTLSALFDDYRESDLSHADAHNILVRYPVRQAARAALLKALSHQPPRAPDEPGDRAREAGKFRSIPDGDA